MIFGGATQAALSVSELRQVQERLMEAGFNPGPVDGVMGQKSRAALRDYQAKQGLAVTGEPDARTLKTLLEPVKKAGDGKEAEQVNPPLVVTENESARVVDGMTVTQPVDQGSQVAGHAVTDSGFVFTAADWTRLVLLLLLGLGALGAGGWFIASVIGLGLAWVLNAYVGWMWSWSMLAGLAISYLIPVLFALLIKSIGSLISVILIIGAPAALISHYLFETGWMMGLAYGAILAFLLPVAVFRLLSRFGLVNQADENTYVSRNSPPQWSSSAHGAARNWDEYVRSGSPSQSSSSPIRPR